MYVSQEYCIELVHFAFQQSKASFMLRETRRLLS